MKKQFIKPELKLIAMETSSICAGSDGTSSDPDIVQVHQSMAAPQW